MKHWSNKTFFSHIDGITVMVLLISWSFANVAQANTEQLPVYINTSVFKNPGEQAYVELYMKIPAHAVNFKKQDGQKFYGMLEIQLQYRNEDEVHYKDHYSLVTEKIKDTTERNFYVIDLKRTALPRGEFLLDYSVQDAYDTTKRTTAKRSVNTQFSDSLEFSQVQLVDTFYQTRSKNKFSRNGLDLVPNVLHHFPEKQTSLYFYLELYHAQQYLQTDHLYLKYSIQQADSVIKEKLTKQSSKPINFLFGGFEDISGLNAGSYNLVCELYNTHNQQLSQQKVRFSRGGAGDNIPNFALKYQQDTLELYIDYLTPISNRIEIDKADEALDSNDSLSMANYFFKFWKDRSAYNPEKAWHDYLKKLNYVDEQFGTNLTAGYHTDRGRIFLQYGPPNQIVRSIDDPSTLPYKIWQYYSTKLESNVKFIFYNPTQLGNDYILLHSNSANEITNPNWQEVLERKKIYDDPFGTDPRNDFQK